MASSKGEREREREREREKEGKKKRERNRKRYWFAVVGGGRRWSEVVGDIFGRFCEKIPGRAGRGTIRTSRRIGRLDRRWRRMNLINSA